MNENTELTLPQFINIANIPELNSQFVTILKLWKNYININHFRFNPILYRKIYPDLANMNDQDLCRYYFNYGILYKPLCSSYALNKLIPNYNKLLSNSNVCTGLQATNMNPTATDSTSFSDPFCSLFTPGFSPERKREVGLKLNVGDTDDIYKLCQQELFTEPTSKLLSRYINVLYKNTTKYNYKCIIAVQFSSLSPAAYDLLKIIQNIIQSSTKLTNSHDILLFINITSDVLVALNSTVEEYSVSSIQQIKELCNEYIISSSENFGTDIPIYFMMLNNLENETLNPITSDYILKLHTKNDSNCIKQMTNCFCDGKLEKAINTLDNVATIDILGGKDLVMQNYHVHTILKPLFSANPINSYDKLLFVAGSAFLSRFKVQHNILFKYSELIKNSVLLCQYISGWFFQLNSPTHALERIIGGFESQANNKTVRAWL